MTDEFQRPHAMNDLLERHKDRVQEVLNILLESPYFYPQDKVCPFFCRPLRLGAVCRCQMRTRL